MRDDVTFALHVDCDPLWIYSREYGIDPGSAELIYTQALPRLLDLFDRAGAKATLFVIGQELQHAHARTLFQRAVGAGHRLANHTQHHLVDFAAQDEASVRREIAECHEALRAAFGCKPVGFRAPGYAHLPSVATVLAELGYQYDGSVLPGPASLAMSAYMRMRGQARDKSFGGWSNLLASTRVKRDGAVAQVPIAVLPLARLPVHTTFIYLFGIRYLDFALRMLSRRPGHHVLLLHAIDALDHPQPERFKNKVIPMRWTYQARIDTVSRILNRVAGGVVLTEQYLAQGRRIAA